MSEKQDSVRKCAIALAIGLFVIAGDAQAAEIRALITTAMKPAMDELALQFERTTGHTLRITYGPSGALARRAVGGEPADLIVVAEPGIGELIRHGKVAAGWISVARTEVGVAVRKGAPRPDISSADALKRALLAAKTVAYVAPASGGVTGAKLVEMYDRLGIGADIAVKARLAAGGPDGRVSALVAKGEAEIGLQQISELLSNPDVDVIGTLPAELRMLTVYAAGIPTGAKETEAAKALILLLTAPAAAPVYKAKGLDPV